MQSNFSKVVRDNLTALVNEHHRNHSQTPGIHNIPFLPPPPPLQLSKQIPTIAESTTTKYNSLEQNYLSAQNAAAMMKLQAALNTSYRDVSVKEYKFFNWHKI